MNKTFAISALSLAIAAGNVSASGGPQTCVSEGGQGDSLAEWGMWCGVGSFLSALSEMDPTASGPTGPDTGLDIADPTGRGESDGFEPGVNVGGGDQHIIMPTNEEARFSGYFAGREVTYDYLEPDQEGGEGPVAFSIPAQQMIDSGDVGSVALDLEDGYSSPDYEGDDVVDLTLFDVDGGEIYSRQYEAPSSDYDDDYASVYLDDFENDGFFANGYGDDLTTHTVWGGEGRTGDYQILQNYWIGRYDTYQRVPFSDRSEKYFIAGELAAESEILAKISGDLQAVYSGNSHSTYQSVRLAVDFGDKTFHGDFGDMDEKQKYSRGLDENKDLSFTADGVIDGIHLISTEVSADEGFVQGSFFGNGGDIVGGAYDVTIEGDRVTDVFTAVEGEGNRVDMGGPT